MGVKTKRNEIKQKIVATLVVVFMLAMLGGVLKVYDVRADNVDTTTLQQQITTGSLSLESPTQVNFNATTAGTGVNSLANMVQVNMRDYTGTGSGWTTTGSANNMVAGNGAILANTRLKWSPGTIYALDGASNSGVAAGASYSGNFGDGSRTLANASGNNGMGNYVINGTTMNLLIQAGDVTGTYQNTLTLTIA